jgi:hypothetical protein
MSGVKIPSRREQSTFTDHRAFFQDWGTGHEFRISYHTPQGGGGGLAELLLRDQLEHALVGVVAGAHLEQTRLEAIEDPEAGEDGEEARDRVAGEEATSEDSF